jgi:cell division protein FtsN
MAKRRSNQSKGSDYPGWLWMLFGLSIGLAVALAIWLQQNETRPEQRKVVRQATPAVIDDNGEQMAGKAEAVPKSRFDFYDMLPNFEVVIPDQERDVKTDNEAKAVVEAGVYVLQAGSFSRYDDADRRRAQLALQGIESTIQRVSIEDKTYHRVRIGPIDDLNELNLLRSRLRAANIDVLRIRLGD